MIYSVKINRANAEICENLKRFEKSTIYITKMKINVTKDEMMFLNTFETKIFLEKSGNDRGIKDYSVVKIKFYLRTLPKIMKRSS